MAQDWVHERLRVDLEKAEELLEQEREDLRRKEDFVERLRIAAQCEHPDEAVGDDCCVLCGYSWKGPRL